MPIFPTSAMSDSLVNSVSSDNQARALIDARRGRLSVDELLMSASELRAKTLEGQNESDLKLWVVHVAVSNGRDFLFGDHRSAFCTIQPFASEDYEKSMWDAFVSQRKSSDEITPSFEVVGVKADVGRVVFGMIEADEVRIRWLPAKVL